MAYRSPERLYVDKDRTRVVDEGSPDAAFLLVNEGGMVSDEDAKRYGLRERAKALDAAKAEAEPKVEEDVEEKADAETESPADPNLITTDSAPATAAERKPSTRR